MSKPNPLDLLKSRKPITQVGAITFVPEGSSAVVGYQGGLFDQSGRDALLRDLEGVHPLAKATGVVNLDGPDALAKAQALPEGGMGQLGGDLVRKEDGVLVKAKYKRRWKGKDGKWRYEYDSAPKRKRGPRAAGGSSPEELERQPQGGAGGWSEAKDRKLTRTAERLVADWKEEASDWPIQGRGGRLAYYDMNNRWGDMAQEIVGGPYDAKLTPTQAEAAKELRARTVAALAAS